MAHDHNSDPAMDKALRRSLGGNLGAGGENCPDPSLLAAYFDHELSAKEAERWEAHFSTCGRCQEQLAVLARTEPAVAAAQTQTRPVGWRQVWSLRWLAPLAAAAAAVVLWVAIRTEPPTMPAPSATVASREVVPTIAPPAGAKTAAEAGKVAQAAEAEKANLAGKRSMPQKPAAGPAPVQQLAPAPEVAVASAEKKEADTRAAQAPADIPARDRAQAVVVAEAAQDEMKAQPRAEAAAAPAEATRSKMAAAEVQKAAPSAAPTPSAGEVPGRLEASKGMMALRAPLGVVTSPEGKVLWRFGVRGLIEKSTDAGQTWSRQSSPVTANLLTGFASSEKVCWAIGAGGTILRTTDGEHWEKVPSPTSDNLHSITARDALHATVTTTGGQAFVTTDGGKTWHVQ